MRRLSLHGIVDDLWLRPALAVAVDAAVVAPVALAPDPRAILSAYAVAAPWLAGALLVANVPAIALFAVHVPVARKHNHALEHATIHYLNEAESRVLAGRAYDEGFRILGRVTPGEIHAAFDLVAARIRAGAAIPHISEHCGSNRFTTLAFGVALLAAATAMTLGLGLELWQRVLLLLATAAVYLTARKRFGNWAQGRFFMATDFREAAIEQIRRIRGSKYGGRTVYFVRTRVAGVS